MLSQRASIFFEAPTQYLIVFSLSFVSSYFPFLSVSLSLFFSFSFFFLFDLLQYPTSIRRGGTPEHCDVLTNISLLSEGVARREERMCDG